LIISGFAASADTLLSNAPVDLAKQAFAENLPQVSAAVLRTQIQQEQDPPKKMELTQRLLELLVAGGRYREALEVMASFDAGNDPKVSFWKAVSLLGIGDAAGAKAILTSLHNSGTISAAIPSDLVTLCLARSLRANHEPDAALEALRTISKDSAFAEDVLLEEGVDLVALNQLDEAIKLMEKATFQSNEGKSSAIYLKAIANWRAGKTAEARRLFASVQPASPWISSASTYGEALCLSSSTNSPEGRELGIGLLEKHLEKGDESPLIEEQFKLLDQLYLSSGTSSTSPSSISTFSTLKKWAQDSSKPTRAKYADFYQSKNALSLHQSGDHQTGDGESLMETFIRKYPDDPLADQGRLLLASALLQRGLPADALVWSADRSTTTPGLRARLAFIRGLAEAASNKTELAQSDFQTACSLEPSISGNALFNQAVLISSSERGALDLSQKAKCLVEMNAGEPSEEMEFQIALDLTRRGEPSALSLLSKIGEESASSTLKSRARLAAAELNMKSGKGEEANQDLSKAVHEYSGEPEREEYLGVFLKDTGRKSDSVAVATSARAFLTAHPDSRFAPEVRLKLAETLLATGDEQGARVQFEQLASTGAGSDLQRRSLFLAAQSASRSMDPSSIDDSLMLLERVASTGTNDQLVWQARLQEGSLKNSQNLPLEALVIYDKILTSRSSGNTTGPDNEIFAAALMAKGDTQHQLGAKDQAQEWEAVKTWRQLASDSTLPVGWRNQALCKSGLILETLGDEDAALAAFYEAFKNPRADDPEQLWHDKAAFEAARLLENRKQWNDAVVLFTQLQSEGGPRSDEAKARLNKLRLQNFLWEN